MALLSQGSVSHAIWLWHPPHQLHACITYPLTWVTERLHSGLDCVYRIHSCMLCDACYCSSHHVLQVQKSTGDQWARVRAGNCRSAIRGSNIPIGILCWSNCC